MASQDWAYDFCFSCDRQIAEGGIYCSQSCRLADLEKAGNTQLSSSASSTSSSNTGFYLPPAVNFPACKAPTSPYHYYPTANGSYFAPPTTTSQSQRSLTPSSSRSSLASNGSQTSSGITAQAANQLNNYSLAFDQTRDMKRRCTQY